MEPGSGAKRDYGDPSGLLQSHDLYKYILDMNVYPRESDLLKELRDATIHKPYLVTAPDAGQFLALILKMINAKKTIEIGVYTGYSLLFTALSIPQDGKIVAVDVDGKPYKSIGLPIIKKANVENKIEFIESEALLALDLLLENVTATFILSICSMKTRDSVVSTFILEWQQENEGSFDFAFVDADKINQKEYHERLMKLVKVGGVIIYDNTLWGGTVALQQHPPANGGRSHSVQEIIEFNKMVAADSRVDISQVALGDGITMCRRIF